jgi:NitT/TauT family transport system substrate-binding protein
MGIHETARLGRLRRYSRHSLGCHMGLIALAIAASIASGTAAAQTSIRFTLDAKFEGPAAPFLMGVDKGYYKAENLAVTVDAAADPLEPISRVASGAYDMGVADINFLIKYRDQNPGAPIKAVFMVQNKPAYAIVGRKSRGITVPKDLEGKKLGAPATDVSFAQWKIFAQANSIDATKVAIENIGFPVREPLLQNAQVDAVTGFSYSILPNLKSMSVPADDIVELLMADHGVNLYGTVIIVNAKFAAEKPDAVKGFLNALVRGLKESARTPLLAVETVLKRNDALIKDVELERLRLTLRENIMTPEVKLIGLGSVDYARLDQSVEQLALVHEFKAKPKAVDIFDATYLPATTARKTH